MLELSLVCVVLFLQMASYPNGAVAMLLLCIPGSEQRFLPSLVPPPNGDCYSSSSPLQFTGGWGY